MNFGNSVQEMMSRQLHPNFCVEKLVVNRYATLAGITSGCILAALLRLLHQEFKSLLFNTVLRIHMSVLPTEHEISNSVRNESKLPGIIPDKIDVRNVDNMKLVERSSGKGKKKSAKKGGGKGNSNKGGNRNGEEEKSNQRKKEEEDRLKKWNEDWEKKLKAQEALDDIPCCSMNGLRLKPKTQSNIWIKVTREKKIQDVQMAFMHVPVPKPKAPPLPKLVRIEPVKVPPVGPVKKKEGKKKGKGKKK